MGGGGTGRDDRGPREGGSSGCEPGGNGRARARNRLLYLSLTGSRLFAAICQFDGPCTRPEFSAKGARHRAAWPGYRAGPAGDPRRTRGSSKPPLLGSLARGLTAALSAVPLFRREVLLRRASDAIRTRTRHVS